MIDGGALTVSVALLEVALPQPLLNTAWYRLPLSDGLAGNSSVPLVAPGMLVNVTPPSVLTCHCTAKLSVLTCHCTAGGRELALLILLIITSCATAVKLAD